PRPPRRRHQRGLRPVLGRVHVGLRRRLLRPSPRRGRAPRPGPAHRTRRAPRLGRRRARRPLGAVPVTLWDGEGPAAAGPRPVPTRVTASVSRDLATPARALAIAAHPDDVEFQCGATLAKWAAAGCEVSHLICTDGSKGTWDVGADLAALVVTRQAEQHAAAKALGATGEVVFLGWPDGELDTGLRQRWEVAYWIRRLRPDVVLGHDPWKRYRLHPDHRAAGLLACDGVVAAR